MLAFALPVHARIIEIDRSFPIDTHAKRIDIVLPVQGDDGWLRYRLICRGGSEEYLGELGRQKNIYYVPPLICTLQEGNYETESSLLGEDDSATWYTRGQFHWDELLGACGDYPEYGRVRHFILRGMAITLEARDLKVREGQLDSFILHVTFRNDAAALSRYALRPGYLPPRGNCDVVRKGIEPRMCRSNHGSYEECQSGELRPLDKRVLEFALSRDGAVYDELRAQIPYLQMESRYPDPIGFNTYFRAKKGAKPAGGGSVAMDISDISGRSPEAPGGMMFLIRVEDGLIVMLEGVTYTSDEWPKDESRIRLEIVPVRKH